MLSRALAHAHARPAIRYGLTVEGRRDAAFAINEPFVLIEGMVLLNLKSHRHRRGCTKERNLSHIASKHN